MEIKANSGDYISVKLAKREIKGTILESYDKDVILVKLDSGYNIGVPRDNVFDVRVIRKYKEEKKKYEIPVSKGKPKVGLIVTGGTIASKLDARTGGVTALTDLGEFAAIYPRLFEKYDFKMHVPFMELSENMNSEHWKKIAKAVQEMCDDDRIKGVILTHGTDTLYYTSAALSFFLRNLNKPVVLTFSQKSIDRASSDAELNLECAAEFALSNCAEVVILGHATENDDYCNVLRGTKVRKMHASRRDAFKAVNCKPIAKAYPGRIEFLEEYNAKGKGMEKSELDDKFSDKVALVKFYPGMDAKILDYYKSEGYKGIIIEMVGLGHVSSDWISKLKSCIKAGIIVCGTAGTIYGSLNPKVYSTGREIEKAGVLYLKDMLSETAFVKLGWVLGHRNWKGKEKEKMLENFAGEFNEFLSE